MNKQIAYVLITFLVSITLLAGCGGGGGTGVIPNPQPNPTTNPQPTPDPIPDGKGQLVIFVKNATGEVVEGVSLGLRSLTNNFKYFVEQGGSYKIYGYDLKTNDTSKSDTNGKIVENLDPGMYSIYSGSMNFEMVEIIEGQRHETSVISNAESTQLEVSIKQNWYTSMKIINDYMRVYLVLEDLSTNKYVYLPFKKIDNEDDKRHHLDGVRIPSGNYKVSFMFFDCYGTQINNDLDSLTWNIQGDFMNKSMLIEDVGISYSVVENPLDDNTYHPFGENKTLNNKTYWGVADPYGINAMIWETIDLNATMPDGYNRYNTQGQWYDKLQPGMHSVKIDAYYGGNKDDSIIALSETIDSLDDSWAYRDVRGYDFKDLENPNSQTIYLLFMVKDDGRSYRMRDWVYAGQSDFYITSKEIGPAVKIHIIEN